MTRSALALVLLAFLPTASAHVEFLPGQGASLNQSVWLGTTPTAIDHSALPEHGGIRYYTIDLQADQAVRIQLLRNAASFTSGIPPSLAIIGPNITARGLVPTFLERPNGTNAQIVQGTYTDAIEYHPVEAVARSPLVNIEFTPPETARYHIVVFDENDGGGYALKVGDFPLVSFRSFAYTPREATDLREWEGQTFAHTTLPTILGTIAGATLVFALTRSRRHERIASTAWFTLGASALYLGSAASYAHQATHHRTLGLATIVPTLGLALASLLLAAALIGNALWIKARPTPTQRVLTAILGVTGLLVWAGCLWGPSAAIGASLFPDDEPPSPEGKS